MTTRYSYAYTNRANWILLRRFPMRWQADAQAEKAGWFRVNCKTRIWRATLPKMQWENDEAHLHDPIWTTIVRP